MLAKLFGKKTDHPLADMKSAQAILNDLPKSDPIKSLMELTDWVESVTEVNEFKLDHQFALIRMLDEAGYTHARKLSNEYFAAHELSMFQENRLWLVLGSWYRNLYNAYLKVFKHYCDGDKGSASINSSVALLVSRTVRCMMSSLKFACVHYGPIDSQIWMQLGLLYKHAESHRYQDAPVQLYPAMIKTSSVQLEAGHLLAWYGCGVSSLSPLAMHLTERIIEQYNSEVNIQAKPSECSLFGFDLNAPSLPRRVNVDSTVHPHMRFICMPELQVKLENLIQVLNKNIVPDDLILGGEYEPELVKEAAEYLLKFMTVLPKRKALRKQISIKTKVVRGFPRMVTYAGLGTNFEEDQVAEWNLDNISTAGFYTVLAQSASEQVRIGELVGIKPEALSYWGLAIIRRLMRDTDNHLHVGAEIFSNQTSSVTLSQSGGGSMGFEDGQVALWLHHKVGEEVEGKVFLLVSKYVPNCSLQTELQNKKYLLIPIALKQRHLDCDLVEFRVIERDESEE